MFDKLFNWIKRNSDKEPIKNSEILSTSYTEHILIDYDDFLPQDFDKLPCSENTHIWLFIDNRQTKLNTELMQSIQGFKDRAHQIYLDISYKQLNTLDFILSYYLGYIAATYPQAQIAILSKCKGYEAVADHALKLQDFSKITHYSNHDHSEKSSKPLMSNDVSSYDRHQSTTVEVSFSPFEQSFKEAIIYLTNPNKYHPRLRKRLENLFAKEIVMPIFSKKEKNFSEENALYQARKLVDQLRVSRLIEIEDKDIGLLVYHTDEKSLYQRMKYFVLRKKPKCIKLLKEIIAYNYSHREIDSQEMEILIEKLKQENILSIHQDNIYYLEEKSALSHCDYDLEQLTRKTIEFLKVGHALPRNKSSLYNAIGTHINTKDNDEVLQIIIDRLIHRGLVKLNGNQVIYPKNSRN